MKHEIDKAIVDPNRLTLVCKPRQSGKTRAVADYALENPWVTVWMSEWPLRTPRPDNVRVWGNSHQVLSDYNIRGLKGILIVDEKRVEIGLGIPLDLKIVRVCTPT